MQSFQDYREVENCWPWLPTNISRADQKKTCIVVVKEFFLFYFPVSFCGLTGLKSNLLWNPRRGGRREHHNVVL